jgi:hypothetical protein
MFVNVPIYFFLNTIQRRMNNAMIGFVFFNELVYERNNNREATSNDNAQNLVAHVIRPPARAAVAGMVPG